MYKVVLEPRAKDEIFNATQFYFTNANPKISDKFIDEFISIIEILQINPNFSLKSNQYRAIPFPNFPFIVFYRIHFEEKIVSIESVFHTSQNPKNYPK